MMHINSALGGSTTLKSKNISSGACVIDDLEPESRFTVPTRPSERIQVIDSLDAGESLNCNGPPDGYQSIDMGMFNPETAHYNAK